MLQSLSHANLKHSDRAITIIEALSVKLVRESVICITMSILVGLVIAIGNKGFSSAAVPPEIDGAVLNMHLVFI